MKTHAWIISVVALAVGLSIGVAAGAPPDLPLIDAVKNGAAAEVRELISQQVDVNSADLDGTTALHWAAHRENVDAVALLLDAGADASVGNRFGATPLLLASENANVSVINALLAAGADPGTATADGETALMRVARNGRADAVRTLLSNGADPNVAESWRGQTALMWAAAENNVEAANALIAGGADIVARSNGGFSPLMFAVRAGHADTTRALIAAGADVNEMLPNGTSALVMATTNGRYELGVALLELGANPNLADQGWTALHQVVWVRRPNHQYNNPAAIPTGAVSDLDFIRALVSHGADINARMTREVRDRRRNVLNRVGATPFLLSAKVADVELMSLLVELGADPLIPNEDGATPLMAAAGLGIFALGENPGTNDEALAAVKYARELGGEVTTVDAKGDTALHGAIVRGSEELVRYLLDEGSPVDQANRKGWTPLRIAKGVWYENAVRRWPELEPVLLAHGADPAKAGGADNQIGLSNQETLERAKNDTFD